MSHDEETERELRDAAELQDPVPPHLVRAAVTAVAWRTVDADLAELVFDSLAEPAAAVRGPDRPRLLTFRAGGPTAAGGLTVELELASEGATRHMIGRLSPAAALELEVRHSRGAVTVCADALGRFAAGGLAPGPVRLRCRPAGDGPAVVTDWFTA